MATIELWHHAKMRRGISSTLASRGLAVLLEHHAAERNRLAAYHSRIDHAGRMYERIAFFS